MEKEIRHVLVIVLAGVHQHMIDPLARESSVMLFYGFAQSRNLHEIRSRTNDG
jgi:hypothetical protein